MSLTLDQKDSLRRVYEIMMDELRVAQEDYGDAAARVTRLTEVTNTLRNMLDA